MTTERHPKSNPSGGGTEIRSNEALVVGGGVAGMTAAIDIANQGYKVTLLEKSPSIGGVMAQIDKTFPTLDCSACILTPKLSEVARHPNIDLLTYSEIKSVSGETGDFRVRVHRHARYVDESKCSGCGDCISVCPVEVPNMFDSNIGFRKAIYTPFPQATPNVVTVDKKGEPACRATCPAEVNAQGFVTMMRHGKFDEALEIVRRSIPFPGVLGRVCISFCEAECERGMLDESISIRNLHRFLADYERSHGAPPVEAKIDKKERVAVIGAGPGGISCAYHLARRGYPVTIFEKQEKAGGMLRYSIPEYRLPREILDEEIQRVIDMGVKIKTGTTVKSIHELLEKGFKAVFVATGAWESNKLGINGEDSEGVVHAIRFLEEVNNSQKVSVGERVVVVGGGDAAIDSARVAMRLGAKEVTVVYRRSHVEIPAIPSEVDDAQEEGIKFMLLTNPVEILTSKGHITGIRCVKMRLGEPDHSGRRRPVPIMNSEFTMAVDELIVAVGQSADPRGVQNELDCTEWATVKADPVTLATNVPGVFAGGDVFIGPSTVVKAVGHGKHAAESIDRYIQGIDLMEGRAKERHRVQSYEVDKSLIPVEGRSAMPKQSLASRKRAFSEVELGFNEPTAITEAERCLGCAVCCECERCVEACTREAIDHSMHDEIVDLHVGAIILATGYRLFDVTQYPQYGYGKIPNVITAMEYERLMNAAGPTHGHLVRLSDGKIPHSIGFIQCVGARDVQKGVPFCSRVCCMYGVKLSVMSKEHHPDSEVTVYYADIRAFGKGFEEFFEMARTRFKVNFVRGRVAEVMHDRENDKCIVRFEDTESGELRDVVHDLVIISPGVQPPEGLEDLAVELNMDLSDEGYVSIHDAVLTPVDTDVPGVFVAGCADGPKDIPDSVSAGSAAAMRATIILSKVDREEE
ncbi:MAG: FAD-dependent oxidoreductase [Candidatus Thorarchaeota archaeon]|nr:FAD-dependent oxidoreductase [Candidatus Thorarchaeota archaeon]